MKQRSLLALLLLFASVEMIKANTAFKVKLPANSGNVKLMVTGTITSEQKSEVEAVCGEKSVSGNTILYYL